MSDTSPATGERRGRSSLVWFSSSCSPRSIPRLLQRRLPTIVGELGGPASHDLTTAGRKVLQRLNAARRAGLAELLADWSPEQHRELSEFLRVVASDLAREAPTGRGGARS